MAVTGTVGNNSPTNLGPETNWRKKDRRGCVEGDTVWCDTIESGRHSVFTQLVGCEEDPFSKWDVITRDSKEAQEV